MAATMPKSCVTRMTATPAEACTSLSSSRYWAWMVTSSAVGGSSAISRRAPHRGRALLEETVAGEHDAAAGEPARRLGDQPDQRETGHRLPRARLADEGQRLAGMEREAHAVDRPGDAATGEEMGPEILHHQQRWSGARHLAFTFTSS